MTTKVEFLPVSGSSVPGNTFFSVFGIQISPKTIGLMCVRCHGGAGTCREGVQCVCNPTAPTRPHTHVSIYICIPVIRTHTLLLLLLQLGGYSRPGRGGCLRRLGGSIGSSGNTWLGGSGGGSHWSGRHRRTGAVRTCRLRQHEHGSSVS